MKKGILYILSCYLLWGVLPIFWKMLQSLNPIYVLASRIFWSLIFCLIIILLSNQTSILWKFLKNKREMIFLFFSSIFITINWGLYIYAVVSGHIVEGSLAYFLSPLISVLLGFFFYGEKLDKNKVIAIIFAFIGVLIPIIYYGKIPLISLSIAFSFSIYGALKKNVKSSSIISVFIETLYVTPIAIFIIIFFEKNSLGALNIFSKLELILIPLTGVLTAIPQLLFAKGIKLAPLSLSGILMYINPFMQFLLGILIYKEQFSKIDLLTFIFIWIALIIYIKSVLVNNKNIDKI